MTQQKPESRKSLVSQALKDYRKMHNITQESLAEILGKDPRTLRSWENEHPPKSIRELMRISDLLGIEPERLGLTASLYIPRTPEEIEAVIKHAWSLIKASRALEARIIIENLIQNLQTQITAEKPELLGSLVHAYHAMGHSTSLTSSANEASRALPYYREMEALARSIDDQTALNIALTYQGDIYRRIGNGAKAVTYLEDARDSTPHADASARGNSAQLLARAYFRKRDLKDFERAMGESEELAYAVDAETSSTQGLYNLGTVYEEYGRSYADLGEMQKALDYLKLAEENLPQTRLWKLLLMATRALALVKGGELREGIQLATETANESHASGSRRFLDRIYMIDQYIEHDFMKMRKSLREALYGGNNVIDI